MPQPSQTAKNAPRNYKVILTQVGPWPRDFVVTSEQLAEHGAEAQRLLDLKAIELVEEPGTGPTPIVPDEMARQRATREIPAVHPAPAKLATPTP